MDYSKTSQTQEAGEGSIQNQVIGDGSQIVNIENQTVNNVVVPPSDIVTFTTTLSTQVTKQALELCTDVAQGIAYSRMKDFESTWLPRLQHMERITENMLDPKFHFMLRDANITAAKSSRQEDLRLLSELLACHIEKGEDKKIDAGISRAINIVNEIDEDALCALTVVASLLSITPVTGEVNKGLSVLEDLFAKLLFTTLPDGDGWIDHLNVLGCINILSGKFYKIPKLTSIMLDGYFCVGIKKDSDNYVKAIEMLRSNGLDESTLVPNECLPGYVRIPICSFGSMAPPLNDITTLYDHDKTLMSQVEMKFMEIWDSYEHLSMIRKWFEQIPYFFRINSIGKALAQTNAKRCLPSFPDLI